MANGLVLIKPRIKWNRWRDKPLTRVNRKELDSQSICKKKKTQTNYYQSPCNYRLAQTPEEKVRTYLDLRWLHKRMVGPRMNVFDRIKKAVPEA